MNQQFLRRSFLSSYQTVWRLTTDSFNFNILFHQNLKYSTIWLILSFLYRASFQHMKWKTNWCHCFNFIHISTDLYLFRAHTLRLFIVPPGTNGCGNSCVNSPEDGPVGPKHVEIRRYMDKIETVTSVGFSFLMHYSNYNLLFWCLMLDSKFSCMFWRSLLPPPSGWLA